MGKRITAKVGEYQKDGKTIGRYIDIGVINNHQSGEYILLDPAVNLAGVMIKQRLFNPGKAGDSVMCSIFDNSGKGQSAPASNPTGADDFDDDIPF